MGVDSVTPDGGQLTPKIEEMTGEQQAEHDKATFREGFQSGTRVKDIELARAMAKASSDQETYNVGLRQQGMGETAKELEPEIDKVAEIAKERFLGEKAKSIAAARETGDYIGKIASLDNFHCIKVPYVSKEEQLANGLIGFYKPEIIDVLPFDKTKIPVQISNLGSSREPGSWNKTSNPEVFIFQTDDSLNFYKMSV